jgi:hypothetical protein
MSTRKLFGALALSLLLGRSELIHAQPSVWASYTGTNLQVIWPVSSNYDSQVESSGSFLSWQRLGHPFPALGFKCAAPAFQPGAPLWCDRTQVNR